MSRIDYINRRTGHGPFEVIETPARPHIVLVTIDMAPQDFFREDEANGGLVRTPHIDAIRAEAVEFTNAFSNSPLCGPSRASYLTGRYPYLTVNEERAHDGWAVALRDDDIIFPEYLRSVGYVTKHCGKSHVGAQKFIDAFGEADAPWNRWAPPMTDDDGYVAHLKRLGVTPPVYGKAVRGLRIDRKTPGNNYGGFVTQADGSPFPEEGTYAHYTAALAGERLDAAFHQGAQSGAPVYLQVDFFEPHQPFMLPGGLEKRAEEVRRAVRMPKTFDDARKAGFGRLPGEPKIYGVYRRDTGIYDEETMREYIVANVLQMEVLDRAIGKVVAALRERGLWDDALVVFTCDHGEMCGERALVDKGAYAHPKVARVPLVVKPPRAAGRASTRIDTPVCLLDLAPTILEAAGARPAARLDGESLLPFVRGQGDEGRLAGRMFIFEACWHVAPNPAVAFQWKRPDGHYWYAYNLTSELDELYDLSDASYANLAGDPSKAGLKREMLRRLAEFVKSDVRWRCYWHTMRLDREEDLPTEEGDYQMFKPGHDAPCR